MADDIKTLIRTNTSPCHNVPSSHDRPSKAVCVTFHFCVHSGFMQFDKLDVAVIMIGFIFTFYTKPDLPRQFQMLVLCEHACTRD